MQSYGEGPTAMALLRAGMDTTGLSSWQLLQPPWVGEPTVSAPLTQGCSGFPSLWHLDQTATLLQTHRSLHVGFSDLKPNVSSCVSSLEPSMPAPAQPQPSALVSGPEQPASLKPCPGTQGSGALLQGEWVLCVYPVLHVPHHMGKGQQTGQADESPVHSAVPT